MARTARRATKKSATKKTARKSTTKKTTAKAREADSKAKHTATERALKPIAKEINVRLTKAEKLEHDAEDHRLAAAIQLGTAKDECKEVGLNFKKWCESNIVEEGRSYETIRKLAAVGQSENPSEALADMRGRNRKANAEHRERKAVEHKPGGNNTKPQTGKVETIEKTFNSLAERGQRNVLQTLAEQAGLTVMDQEKVRQLNEKAAAGSSAKADAPKSKGNAQDEAENAFRRLTGKQKMTFIEWACDEIGAKVEFFGSDGLPDVPASLRRTSKKTAKKTAKKSARSRSRKAA